MPTRTFPPGFAWGAATSAYQIEGSVDVDGRGASIWDTFTRVEGAIAGGDSGDVACDHYRRWEQDLDLMAELGLTAYRFSIAWPRIQPTGREAVGNPAGLDHYSRLVDGLLERGITPWVTLYHWDLPQPLRDAGGWPARETVDRFVAYTDLVTRHLGDRVQHWNTHNEPWCSGFLAHVAGEQAPGLTDWRQGLPAIHHILLSHGRAVPVVRANSAGSDVGIVLNLCPAWPASPSAADADATRHFDGFFNRWFLDPVHGRGYPADMVRDYVDEGHMDPEPAWLQEGDLDAIAAPTDYLGVNYYSRGIVRNDRIPEADNEPRTLREDPEAGVTDMGWEVAPDGLRHLLEHLHAEYGPQPLVVTENGAAYGDGPGDDGRVRDDRRIDYLRGHLRACHQAIEAGVRLRGYFAWSLMDNFEWAFGFAKRFGLIHVDYATQARTIKDSGRWYAEVIARNGLA